MFLRKHKNVFSNLLFLLPGSESLEMVVEYVWQFWAFNRSCVAQLPFGNEHSPILISQLPGLEYCIPVSPIIPIMFLCGTWFVKPSMIQL